MRRYVALITVLLLCNPLYAVTLLTTMNEATSSTTSWLVRSNVRYAHQFAAGGAATVTSVQWQVSSSQNYPTMTKIIIYADSGSNTIGTKLGELVYSSYNSGTYVITYTGSVSISSAGTYWVEVAPTAAIGNHYYAGTTSNSSTGSTSGWAQKKTWLASGTASNANPTSWTTYFSGTPYHYPKFALLGSEGGGPDLDVGGEQSTVAVTPPDGGHVSSVHTPITVTPNPLSGVAAHAWSGNRQILSYQSCLNRMPHRSRLTYKKK